VPGSDSDVVREEIRARRLDFAQIVLSQVDRVAAQVSDRSETAGDAVMGLWAITAPYWESDEPFRTAWADRIGQVATMDGRPFPLPQDSVDLFEILMRMLGRVDGLILDRMVVSRVGPVP
jgi:hypothetical protein